MINDIGFKLFVREIQINQDMGLLCIYKQEKSIFT